METEQENEAKFSAVCLVIFILGIIGNAIAVFVIINSKEYQKSSTHWYALQLAVADFLFLMCLPLTVSESLNQAWIYSLAICKLKQTALFLNYYASILFLTTMTLDRYFAVCRPFSQFWLKLRKRKSAIIISVLVWLVSLFLCTPTIIHSAVVQAELNCQCRLDFSSHISAEESCEEEKQENDTRSYEDCLLTQKLSTNLDCFNQNSSFFDHFLQYSDPEGSYEYGSGSNETQDDYNSDINLYSDDDTVAYTGISDDYFYIAPQCNVQDAPRLFIALLTTNFVAFFLVPIMVMIVCYSLVIKHFNQSGDKLNKPSFRIASESRKLSISSSNSRRKRALSSSSSQNRKRVTVMCTVLVLTFTICWLPYHAIWMGKISGISNTADEICLNLLKVGSLIGYLNSALNPYLYTFLGSKFSRRWNTATASFRRSISQRRAQSGVSFKRRHRKLSSVTSERKQSVVEKTMKENRSFSGNQDHGFNKNQNQQWDLQKIEKN